MLDANGVVIEYGDLVVDNKYGFTGRAREQSGECVIVWNGKALTRIPLSRAVVIWKPLANQSIRRNDSDKPRKVNYVDSK